MKELNSLEVNLVFGATADFSNVTGSVTSTEQIISDKTFLERIGPFIPGMFR